MPARPDIPAGSRFTDDAGWDTDRIEAPHVWHTLGFQRLAWEPGGTTIAWDAPERYAFPAAGGPIVQGGLVTAILDGAMGGACWTVLDTDQAFLTADIRVEFLRATRPGRLVATGWVVRRTRRVVFCAAELHDGDVDGPLLATARCTEIVLPADGPAGPASAQTSDGAAPAVAGRDDAPPEDGRG